MDGKRNNYRINDPNRRPMVDIRIPNYNTKELEDLYAKKKENVDLLVKRFIDKGKDVIPSWLGVTNITSLYFNYLHQKYNIKCGIYNTNILTTFSEGVKKGTSYSQNEIAIPVVNMTGVQKKEFLNYLNGIAENIAECLEKDQRSPIPIPITLFLAKSAHANLLLIRPMAGTCEHFEPHGKLFLSNGDYANKINKAMDLFIGILNNKIREKKLNLNFTHVPTHDSCPELSGLQDKECKSTLKKDKKEGGGYCAAWSLLIAELALINKSVSVKTIVEEIYKINRSNLNNNLKYLIRAFTIYISDVLEKYYSNISGIKYSIEEILNKKNKVNPFIGGVIFDIETIRWKFNITDDKELYDKTIEYYNTTLENFNKMKKENNKKELKIEKILLLKKRTAKIVLENMNRKMEITPVTKTKLYKLHQLKDNREQDEKCDDNEEKKEKKEKERKEKSQNKNKPENQSPKKKKNKTVKKKKVIVDSPETPTSVKSSSPPKESNKKLNLKELINKTDISAVKLVQMMIEHDGKTKK
jgi:hypothetical protein